MGLHLPTLYMLASIAIATALNHDFCKQSWEGGPPAQMLATADFCQFVCPCCQANKTNFTCDTPKSHRYFPSGVEEPSMMVRKSGNDAMNISGLAMVRDRGSSFHDSFVGELFQMSQKRESNGLIGIDLADAANNCSTFYETVMASVVAKFSLDDFVQYYPEYYCKEQVRKQGWPCSEAEKHDIGSRLTGSVNWKRASKHWTDAELAINLYTGSYVAYSLNELLRRSCSMADIDEYWQTYIYLLGMGLQSYTKYGIHELWRGVTYNYPLNESTYPIGHMGVLNQFASTSQQLSVAEFFAGPSGGILHITGGGYNIANYSDHGYESEVLLEPGWRYLVGAVKTEVCHVERSPSGQNFTIVHLLMDVPNATKRLNQSWSIGTSSFKCPKANLPTCPVCICCSSPISMTLPILV
jgi:hypothetical protein